MNLSSFSFSLLLNSSGSIVTAHILWRLANIIHSHQIQVSSKDWAVPNRQSSSYLSSFLFYEKPRMTRWLLVLVKQKNQKFIPPYTYHTATHRQVRAGSWSASLQVTRSNPPNPTRWTEVAHIYIMNTWTSLIERVPVACSVLPLMTSYLKSLVPNSQANRLTLRTISLRSSDQWERSRGSVHLRVIWSVVVVYLSRERSNIIPVSDITMDSKFTGFYSYFFFTTWCIWKSLVQDSDQPLKKCY
jgi:hypothetical protein